MSGVYEVYSDAKGEQRFRLKAPNGETILASEGYTSKDACMNGINSVKENSALDERYESYEDAAGTHRFRLKAANNQIIGVGEAYESKASLKSGIESVKRWASAAKVKEL